MLTEPREGGPNKKKGGGGRGEGARGDAKAAILSGTATLPPPPLAAARIPIYSSLHIQPPTCLPVELRGQREQEVHPGVLDRGVQPDRMVRPAGLQRPPEGTEVLLRRRRLLRLPRDQAERQVPFHRQLPWRESGRELRVELDPLGLGDVDDGLGGAQLGGADGPVEKPHEDAALGLVGGPSQLALDVELAGDERADGEGAVAGIEAAASTGERAGESTGGTRWFGCGGRRRPEGAVVPTERAGRGERTSAA